MQFVATADLQKLDSSASAGIASRTVAKKSSKQEEPGFEEALAGLENIVAAMERGDVPLAELVARYGQASALLARCRACLDEATLTVERLRSEGGKLSTEALDSSNGEASLD